jgi:tetratricopeptide (TPR) repeat protein
MPVSGAVGSVTGMADEPVLRDVWALGNPEGSRKRFEELADQARERGDTAYLAEVSTQIARAYGLQQRFDEADAVLDEVDGMLTDEMPAASVRSRLERGRIRNSAGDPAASVPLFSGALEQAQRAGLDDLAVDAAHMLGIVEPGDASIDWNERALEMAEESSDPQAQRWKGSLYNNLGWAYHDRGDHAAALGVFERCLAYFTETGQDDRTAIARWSIAKMYRFVGRTQEAVEIQRELLDRPDHRNNEFEGYAQEELAECLLALGRDAKAHFARAYELLHTDPWLSRDEAPRLERLRELGGLPPGTAA